MPRIGLFQNIILNLVACTLFQDKRLEFFGSILKQIMCKQIIFFAEMRWSIFKKMIIWPLYHYLLKFKQKYQPDKLIIYSDNAGG